MVSYKHMYSIERMCKVLKVSRSSYYRWYSNGPCNRVLEDQKLTLEIKNIFYDSRQTYGSPRIKQELLRRGYKVSRSRISRLMKSNGLRSKLKKKYKITTDSNHCFPIFKNHLDREFNPKRLNQVWVSDITYIKTNKGWLYLTTLIDLYDRQVIGWSLSTSLFTDQTIVPAWKMATSKRKIEAPLLFHSDRGVQYASKEFRKVVTTNKLITQSMSRKANCWDNAVAESFFKTLKAELVYHHSFKTIQEAKTAVFDYIEVWYNRKRLHSSLGYKTPIEVEIEFYKLKNVA
ncbi:IS3 family transposase [Aquimarina longa]|uniref:IS3 family transposase n=1 Tax=Aquimarina longa TaxID=1080221 RepID=UPI001F074FE5|nr:IS3 family transposase [Aquimarina longa]